MSIVTKMFCSHNQQLPVCRGRQSVKLVGVYLRKCVFIIAGGREGGARKLADVNMLVFAFLPGQVLLPPCGNGPQTGHPPLGVEAPGDSPPAPRASAGVFCSELWVSVDSRGTPIPPSRGVLPQQVAEASREVMADRKWGCGRAPWRRGRHVRPRRARRQPRGAEWRGAVTASHRVAEGWWGACILLGRGPARRRCQASPPSRSSPRQRDCPATAGTPPGPPPRRPPRQSVAPPACRRRGFSRRAALCASAPPLPPTPPAARAAVGW